MLSREASFLPRIANLLGGEAFVLLAQANRPAGRRKMPLDQASLPRRQATLLPAQQSLPPGQELLPCADGPLPRAEGLLPLVEGPMPRAEADLPPPIATMPPAIAFRSVDDSICHARPQISGRTEQVTVQPGDAGGMSQPRQPLQRPLQRRVLFGEAEAHDALLEAAGIERRQRDRRDAVLARQAAAERLFGLVADRRVVDALEVAAFAGQQLEAGLPQAVAEEVALALVEGRQLQVRRG